MESILSIFEGISENALYVLPYFPCTQEYRDVSSAGQIEVFGNRSEVE
jgi:hypothetical protein